MKRMRWSIKRWWILRFLKWDWLRHISNQNSEHLKNGLILGVFRNAFLDTLSKESRNQKLSKDSLNKRLAEYNALIDSCRDDKLIFEEKDSNGQPYIRVSHFGYDFLARFWWNFFVLNPIMTAIIIGAIGTTTGILITNAISNTLKSKEDQIQRIQIIPTTPTETIIKKSGESY